MNDLGKEPQMNTDKHGFGFEKLVVLFEQTQSELQKQAARSVDIALVIRNWLFGWYIVEFENGGAERAELYGKKLLQCLSAELKQAGRKGVSLTNLKQFRLFYETYKEIGQAVPDQSSIDTNNWGKITQTVFAQSLNVDTQKIRQAAPDQSQETRACLQEIMAKLSARFVLGWTHYVTLLTVKNSEERRFYEIEAAENGWGYRDWNVRLTRLFMIGLL